MNFQPPDPVCKFCGDNCHGECEEARESMTTNSERQVVPTGAQWSAFINELIAVENHARRLGLFETMHAINAAKNKAGFECVHLRDKVSP